ncbi:fimbria/pilus outer membrane usher protein [Aureimonas altamirensis]|uniref:fimbria/pilus outer membrane usher protein n=1 Tax=Aureimonas altamirensis TaxID=370622 RepID=UPI0030179E74
MAVWLLCVAFAGAVPTETHARDLYLEVFVNGAGTGLVAAFREAADNTLLGEAKELAGVGIATEGYSTDADGFVALSGLRGVSYRYDEESQSVHFEAVDEARAAFDLDASGGASAEASIPPAGDPIFGALVNYSLLAGAGGGSPSDMFAFEGVSGLFQPRVFGPLGIVSGGLVTQTNGGLYGTRRLDTTWSYTDPGTMRTYAAGDIITGGLSWTRPVRLGGVQMKRDFSLRPDLVTFPVPTISGSAAVPSTVDLFVDNARRFSGEVPAGPFQITNLPVVTGQGSARLVVRDVQGQEVVSESAFFASPQLLAEGLIDYALEAGFARRFYAIRSFDYDDRFMGSATLRYGLTDGLTVETHVEGGDGLVNGGAGLVAAGGSYGVVSLAGAASGSGGDTGFLVAGGFEFDIGAVRLSGRSQRSFGDYDDIASVTADPEWDYVDDLIFPESLSRPARAIDQLSLAFPSPFDDSILSLNYTRLETAYGQETEIVGGSYSRQVFGKANLFATGFKAVNDDAFGLFAGLTFALGDRVNVTTGLSASEDGAIATVDAARPESWDTGDYGWRLRMGEGRHTVRDASASYRAAQARVSASLSQFDDRYDATLQAEGAVVASDGGVYLTNRIDDAFAVVDVGAPGIAVSHENRPVGRTGRNGRIILPNMRANERNTVSIDPMMLPIDAVVEATRLEASAKRGSGVRIDFGSRLASQSALVEFVHVDGGITEPVPVGTLVTVNDAPEAVLAGYDGSAFVDGLSARNEALLEFPDGRRCRAWFVFAPRPGEQVNLGRISCEPLTEEDG